jgi:hypothetical protein
MDDNKVAVLLKDLLSKYRTFGEGQETLHNEVHEIKQKDGKPRFLPGLSK